MYKSRITIPTVAFDFHESSVSFDINRTLFLLLCWRQASSKSTLYFTIFMKESAFKESIGVQAGQRFCSTLAWRSRTNLALILSIFKHQAFLSHMYSEMR
jgi:hypothetical protein